MTSQSQESRNGAAGGDAQAEAPRDASESGADAAERDPADGAEGAAAQPDPETELEAARREAAENFDRFVRARAELDNVHKRHQRELGERARYEGEALCRDLLPVIDDLERALSHTGSGDADALGGGVELVLKAMLAALRRHGVERIEAEGRPFDPAEHEAVSAFETADAEPNTVYAVHRAGYRLRDRLLRAAMVTVAKPVAGSGSSDES